ncbi:MAG: hypothetical protein XD95_0236 [Microgenomates bacterium 39_7]|nr:MAG: hypothetical protein XD95_0236 [Microgenomates bacterium 39_7]
MSVKKTIVTISLSVALLTLPHQIYAQTQPWKSIDSSCTIDGVATIQGIMCLIANILSVSLTFIGLAGFVMLIFGSIKWLTSGGNSQALESSKKTITFAFSGLVLALLSFLIINTIAEFTGVNVITQFFIPSSDTGVNSMDEWNFDDAPAPPAPSP